MFMIYIWLAVICVGLLVEVLEAGTLVSIWFSLGALIPFFMSFYRVDYVWYIALQVGIFGVVTLLSLIFLRKVAKKTLFRNNKEKTNLDAIVGKKLKIVSQLDDVFYAKLNGVEYRVVCDEDVKVGDKVEVVKLEGNKLIAKKVDKGE